jgi:aspartyl aminopeptidase
MKLNNLKKHLSSAVNSFHATQEMSDLLLKHGYIELYENCIWDKKLIGKFFVRRNRSSIIAFNIPAGGNASSGWRFVGAHTDSPCLKVKPNPCIPKKGYRQLAVEVYGGALLNPWFDRDLSLAGRVSYQTKKGVINSALLNFIDPIAIIPSLAIHLDREANKNRSINSQTDIVPIISLANDDEFDFSDICKSHLQQNGTKDIDKILDFELFFYDTQKPATVGINKEFLASARLDNLLSCFVGLSALISSDPSHPCMLICTDHEEVGSQSACGADSPFLQSVLERLNTDKNNYHKSIAESLMVSVDNAHAIHPNFANKHDGNHGPIINQGPVIKINANQRYASNSETSAILRSIASKKKIPLQSFVVRSDMACGSTIGPITASNLGVKTIDIGVPTLAMHSIRELAGCKDIKYLDQLLTSFFESNQVFL